MPKPSPSRAPEPTVEPKSTSLPEVLESCVRASERRRRPPSPAASGTLIGEVVDTHHPDLPGRVFVAWVDGEGERCRRWIPRVGGSRPRVGDRVLLTRPTNDPEWIVLAVLAADAPAAASEPDPSAPKVRLEPGEALTLVAHDGTPLLELRAGARGPMIRPLTPDLELDVPGRLRLGAETLELRAATGGVDIRTEADLVARGRFIRLN